MDLGAEGASTSSSRSKRWQWAGGVVAVVAGISTVANALDSFRLPACDSDTALSTVREIFAEGEAPLEQISDVALVSDTDSDRNCSARIRTKDESAQITYRLYWEGWSKQVQIQEVNLDPAEAKPVAPPA